MWSARRWGVCWWRRRESERPVDLPIATMTDVHSREDERVNTHTQKREKTPRAGRMNQNWTILEIQEKYKLLTHTPTEWIAMAQYAIFSFFFLHSRYVAREHFFFPFNLFLISRFFLAFLFSLAQGVTIRETRNPPRVFKRNRKKLFSFVSVLTLTHF